MRTLICLVVLGFTACSNAAPIPPAKRSFAAEVVATWKEAGAEVGWLGFDQHGGFAWQTELTATLQQPLPSFRVTQASIMKLAQLPDPKIAFGLLLPNNGDALGLSKEHLGALSKFRELCYLRGDQVTFTNADVAALRECKHLTALALSWSEKVENISLQGLVGMELRHLDLSGSAVTDKSMKHLAAITTLQHVDLHSTNVTDRGLAELAPLKKLQRLRVGNYANPDFITDQGLKVLAELPDLELLDVSVSHVTGTGCTALTQLPKLKHLCLDHAQANDKGMAAIAKLPQLEILEAVDNQITDVGLKALAGHRRLRILNVAANNITDAGLEHLTTMPALRSATLAQAKEPLTDAGLKHLARCTTLEKLDLSGANLTAQGLQSLAPLKQLQSLEILFVDLSPKELLDLQTLWPKAALRHRNRKPFRP